MMSRYGNRASGRGSTGSSEKLRGDSDEEGKRSVEKLKELQNFAAALS
jgi:hypothetical protein